MSQHLQFTWIGLCIEAGNSFREGGNAKANEGKTVAGAAAKTGPGSDDGECIKSAPAKRKHLAGYDLCF